MSNNKAERMSRDESARKRRRITKTIVTDKLEHFYHKMRKLKLKSKK